MRADIERVLDRRHDNGADFWASPDGKIYVGNPFSTLGSLNILHELDVPREHEAISGALGLILATCRDDGRIRLGPKSPLYPCYTAEAARILCRFGLAGHESVERTVAHLLDSAHSDGGWRCSFSRFGKGPETTHSNPGATLYVLDVFRFRPELEDDPVTIASIETLMDHWVVREPTGPCHWGIGSTFLQVEYPFLRYNLFYFVYVLSHYGRAREDERFREAFSLLDSKRDGAGRVVVERPHRSLGTLDLCRKGQPSDAATRRFREIEANLDVS